MERVVANLDLDSFFVSVERVRNSKLNDIPLIIGSSSGRGIVASCSYEARKFGVTIAMPMRYALRLCPQARVLKGDMELYSDYSHLITQIIESEAPLMEKASLDEFYIDVTGMDRFFGCFKWTDELARKITRESGLPLSFGVSVNKTVSKIATAEGKPLGKLQVEKPNVRPFLNPLSIKKIPALGDSTFQLLSRIGVRKIETLADMPPDMLKQLVGSGGTDLWKKANGIDEQPVEPYTEKKSVSTEQSFDQDTIDLARIRSVMVSMIEKLGFQLRKEQWLTSTVVVKIKYNNLDTHTMQSRIPYTSCDHLLIKAANALFDKLYERRMRLRLVGVRLTGLVRGNYQINLFEDTSEMISLYQAIDRMKNRYGVDAVHRAV